MNTDAIAAQFLDRTTSGHTWLTRKQAAWLYDTFTREMGSRITSHGTPQAYGHYQGKDWTMSISHNGSGYLTIDAPAKLEQTVADPRTAELMELMLTGKMNEARALADAIRADAQKA